MTCIGGTIRNNYTSSSWTHCFCCLYSSWLLQGVCPHQTNWRLPANECCVICHIIITWCLSHNVAHLGSFIPVEFVRITAIAFFVDFVQKTGSSRHEDLTDSSHTHSDTYLRYTHTHTHTHTHYEAFRVAGGTHPHWERGGFWVIVSLFLMTCFLCKTGEKRQYAIMLKREQLNGVDEQSGFNHALSALDAIKLQ